MSGRKRVWWGWSHRFCRKKHRYSGGFYRDTFGSANTTYFGTWRLCHLKENMSHEKLESFFKGEHVTWNRKATNLVLNMANLTTYDTNLKGKRGFFQGLLVVWTIFLGQFRVRWGVVVRHIQGKSLKTTQLLISTHLKHLSEIESFPQASGWKSNKKLKPPS